MTNRETFIDVLAREYRGRAQQAVGARSRTPTACANVPQSIARAGQVLILHDRGHDILSYAVKRACKVLKIGTTRRAIAEYLAAGE